MDQKKLSRRDVLRGSAAAGAGILATASGMPAMAEDKKPDVALPQSSAGKLTVIHRNEYFAAAQDIFRETVERFAKENNAELDISTTNAEAYGDFLGKLTAAVKAGNPPDLAYTSNVSIQQMALLGVADDVSDVMEEVQKKYGKVMTGLGAENSTVIDGKWMSIPFITNTRFFGFRGDKLKAKGIDPATLTKWDVIRDAALAISDPAGKFWGWGNTVNQSGDGNQMVYTIIQAFGGHYTDPTGKIVTYKSPETLGGLKWLVETYDRKGKYADMLPPGVESWSDTSNNEAYLAGAVGFTANAYSVYAAAKKDQPEVFKNTVLLRHPTANNGDNRDGGSVGGWLTVFKGSPNNALARKLALYILDPANFNKMTAVAGGLLMPAYENLWTPELLAEDPNYAIIKEQASVAAPFPGAAWPAKPSAAIQAIRAQGIPEQMVANVLNGSMTAEQSLDDAHKKIVEIFEAGGMKQP
jgi:multiple sugar transport system substrate-binding protein